MAKEDWDSVARTWRDLGLGLKGIIGFCAASGVVLGLLGIVQDGQDWWGQRPFLVNLVSSAVVALIGFPLGLVVVKTVTVLQEARVERLSAFRLARASAQDLHERAQHLLNGRDAYVLRDLLKETERRLVWCRNLLSDTRGRQTSRTELENELAQASELVNSAERSFREFSTPESGRYLLALENTWRYWDGTVRPRLLSAELGWVAEADVQGRTLHWSSIFDRIHHSPLDIQHHVDNFHRGTALETTETRLEKVEDQLRERQTLVSSVIELVEFSWLLANAVAMIEEPEVVAGFRQP